MNKIIGPRFYGLKVFAPLLLFLCLGGLNVAWAGSGIDRDPFLDSIVSLDLNVRAAVFVEKKNQALYVYENRDGKMVRTSTMACSTGEVIGRKNVSGDKKTPEGVYFFVKEFIDRELAPVYGTRAFPMDYPNVVDRGESRTGSAIWLHGTNKPLRPRESNGCVAIANSDIEYLKGIIDLNQTPVIISDSFEVASGSEKWGSRELISDFLNKWAKAQCNGSYHDYLKFYSASYVPDISWWGAWQKIRKDPAFGSNYPVLSIGSLSLYRTHNSILAAFTLTLEGDGFSRKVGIRKLYLNSEQSGIKILGDEFLPENDSKEFSSKDDPLVVAAVKISESHRVRSEAVLKQTVSVELTSFVKKWAKSWQAGDMEFYGGCYSEKFNSSGMDKDAWVLRKKRLGGKYGFIKVSLSQINVEGSRDKAVVSFVQDYESSALHAVGRKKLLLELEDDEWKIYSEIWKKN